MVATATVTREDAAALLAGASALDTAAKVLLDAAETRADLVAAGKAAEAARRAGRYADRLRELAAGR
jgi:hypothetical protein